MTDTSVTEDERVLFADPAIRTKVLELLKQLARMTTIKDEFADLPKGPEGHAIKDDTLYPNVDELRENMTEDQFIDSVETLEWVIESARGILSEMAPSAEEEAIDGTRFSR
ncbi:hypothetical protein D3C71_190030 [compost metagenome]